MATSQTSPIAETASRPIRLDKKVFDLDSKDEVLVAKVGEFLPVATMAEFVSRLGNDATAILQIVNDGLETYETKRLAASDAPWQLVTEDENDNEVLVPFTGTLISPERSKMLKASIINFAKLMFGYSKQMVAGDVKANREAKQAAKDSALAVILSNPAAVEALKK